MVFPGFETGEALGAALRACSLAMRWREALELPRRTGLWGDSENLREIHLKFHEKTYEIHDEVSEIQRFGFSDGEFGDLLGFQAWDPGNFMNFLRHESDWHILSAEIFHGGSIETLLVACAF